MTPDDGILILFVLGLVVYGACLVRLRAAFLPITFLFLMGLTSLVGAKFLGMVPANDPDIDTYRFIWRGVIVWFWFLSGVGFLVFIEKHRNGNGNGH